MIERLLLLFMLFLSACSKGGDGELSTTSKDHVKVLFVGNSLTATNDVPQLVKEIAKQDGVTIEYTSFIVGGYSLEDHWNEGRVQAELDKGGYDIMIAQQGPSALPESQALLLEYATRYANACQAKGTKLALYMVWPSLDRSFDHDNVILSYTNAATATGAILCPAGLAWKFAWQVNAGLPLYGPDNFHPGIMGSVLAAFTIYGSVAKKDDLNFIKWEESSWKNSITQADLAVLKQAALKAMGK